MINHKLVNAACFLIVLYFAFKFLAFVLILGGL